MIKSVDCSHDDRTLLEYIRQVVIRANIKNLVVSYYFYADINDPDSVPSSHFSYRGSAVEYERSMRPYAFIFDYRMNQQVQRVEIDSDKDECYIEIWV